VSTNGTGYCNRDFEAISAIFTYVVIYYQIRSLTSIIWVPADPASLGRERAGPFSGFSIAGCRQHAKARASWRAMAVGSEGSHWLTEMEAVGDGAARPTERHITTRGDGASEGRKAAENGATASLVRDISPNNMPSVRTSRRGRQALRLRGGWPRRPQ